MEDQSVEVSAPQDGPIPCPKCGNPDPSKIIKCPYCRYVPGTTQLRKAPPPGRVRAATIPSLFLAGAILEIIAVALLIAISDAEHVAAPAVIVVWLLVGLANVLLLVASVAAGVSLGIRAARDR